MTTSGESALDRLSRQCGQAAYGGVVLGLCVGVVLHFLHQGRAAVVVLAATCGLLMIVPVLNLLVVLAEEIRRRDWGFAALAAGVLALIGYAVLTHL